MVAGRGETKLGLPLGISALAHAGVVAALVLTRAPAPPPMPPVYRVNLIAAPAGERAIGVVTPPPVAKPPTPIAEQAPPKAAAIKPNDMPAPPSKTAPRTKPTQVATPVTTAEKKPAADAPLKRAGGGPTGDRGSDVATVRTEGIEFPYPAYLTNIVRQIALNFKPKSSGSGLHADVFFIIQRDGSVSGIRLVTRSGSYAFDLEAMGAVEAAASAKTFGPLPDGFSEPSLPVTFSFDPLRLR